MVLYEVYEVKCCASKAAKTACEGITKAQNIIDSSAPYYNVRVTLKMVMGSALSQFIE